MSAPWIQMSATGVPVLLTGFMKVFGSAADSVARTQRNTSKSAEENMALGLPGDVFSESSVVLEDYSSDEPPLAPYGIR